MQSVVVVGSQWGDEGKGKVVDWLSERADVIVRFQGGHNAGHTLVIDGVTYKLSLLPSGVVRKHKVSIIGNGVVIDPWALLGEIEKVQKQGVEISPTTLKIAENACLILPIHQKLDEAAEALRGSNKIGTTGRGIGPAYEDKVGRRAIRVCDLADPDLLKTQITDMLAHHNPTLLASGNEAMGLNEILNPLLEVAAKILPYVAPVWKLLAEYRIEGRRILFEGAQGIMLDVDYGTYPFVTSSNTLSGSATNGSGSGMHTIGYVLGITKAYTTRVGSGPFPSELTDAIGQQLGERGHEFGTVTGRKRRCGLVRRGDGETGGHRRRHQRHRPHQARRARRPQNPENLHRLRHSRHPLPPPPRRPRPAGRRPPPLRGNRRLERLHPRRRSWAQLPPKPSNTSAGLKN